MDNISKYIDEFCEKRLKYDSELQEAANTRANRETLDELRTAKGSNDFDRIISEAVKQMTRGKDTAIRLYKKLLAFLNEKGIDISVHFPDIPVENTFERLMYIAKYFHDDDASISNLPDKLWVSDRTITEDMNRLTGREDPIQICGRKFIISDAKRKNGRFKQASTVHPLFLTENLTQIILMLKGLEQMSRDRRFREYAQITSVHIWQQLSAYAKNRIKYVLGKLSPEDTEWIERLDEKSADAFYTEKECSIRDVMIDCMKNDKKFCVEYEEEDGSKSLYKDCDFKGGRLIARTDGKTKELHENRVLRSAYTPYELADERS